MLKTLGRTFIILIAASVIGLSWYAVSTTSFSQSLAPDRPPEFAQSDEAAADQLAADEGERKPPPGAEGEEAGNSLSQLFSGLTTIVGQTALVIALVTGVIARTSLGPRKTLQSGFAAAPRICIPAGIAFYAVKNLNFT